MGRSSSPKKVRKRSIRDISGNVLAKIASFSQEEALNHSLPTLGKKQGNSSNFTEFKSNNKSYENKQDNFNGRFRVLNPNITADGIITPEKNYPHKRLPVISAVKKNFSVMSKSRSAHEIPAPSIPYVLERPETPQKIKINHHPQYEAKHLALVNQTFKEYYYQTMAGYSDGRTKTNQDAFYINTSLKNSSNCSLFAVFDGHGPLGHKVSEFLKKNLTGINLLLDSIESRFDPDATYEVDEYTGILEAVCLDINNKLTANKTINSLFSGSTGILVLMHRDIVSCANVGDSRAGLFRKAENGSFSLYKLSYDHTPAEPKEKERVIKAGGKVHPCQGNNLQIRLFGKLYRASKNLGPYWGGPGVDDEQEFRR